MPPPATRARRRISNACRICRQRKVRCDGRSPCSNCVSRGSECVFDEAEKKVVILEKHLRQLQRQVLGRAVPIEEERHSLSVDAEAEDGGIEEGGLIELPGEGVSSCPGPTQKDQWKAIRLCSYLHAALHAIEPESRQGPSRDRYRTPQNLGDEAHRPCPVPISTPLPSKEAILHLAHTVDFYLNRLLFFFNIATLIPRLTCLTLLSAMPKDKTNLTVVQSQLLIIVALGKLFREQDGPGIKPPGSREFWAVENGFPTTVELLREPMVAAELLCLTSWYAMSIGRWDLAVLHVGQALRMMHGVKPWQPSEESPAEQTHRLRIQMTTQIIDTRLSASVANLYSEGIPAQTGYASGVTSYETLDVALSLSVVLRKASRRFEDRPQAVVDSADINTGQDDYTDLLTEMQSIGRKVSAIELQASPPSEECLRELHLWFCHCMIAITLPALLQKSSRDRSLAGRENYFRADTKHAVEICAKYASLGLRMLSYVHDQGFLDFSSVFHLELLALASIASLLTDPSLEENISEVPNTLAQQARTLLRATAQRDYGLSAQAVHHLNYLTDHFKHTKQGLHISLEDSVAQFDGRLLDKTMLAVSTQRNPLLHQENPNPNETTGNSTLVENEILESITIGPCLDGLEPNDDEFTFNMEDLRWLDAVQ